MSNIHAHHKVFFGSGDRPPSQPLNALTHQRSHTSSFSLRSNPVPLLQ